MNSKVLLRLLSLTRLGWPWHGIVKQPLSQPHNQDFMHLKNWLQECSSFVAQDLLSVIASSESFYARHKNK
jgi:hypothetical protein